MENNTYDFCPKCGALVRNRVCSSCGTDYNLPKETEWVSENNQIQEEQTGLENVEAAGVSNEQPKVTNAQGYNQTVQAVNEVNGQQYNYYGGQMPVGSYIPTEKKKTNKILIGAILAVVLLVVVLLVYISWQIAILSKDAIQSKINEDSSVEKMEEPDTSWRDIFPTIPEEDSDNKKADESQMDQEADADYWEEYKNEQAFDYDENFKKERENYDASQITGPYYEEFVNCIDESVSYKVNREFYEEIDKENGACIQISYIQLEGDIPNLEIINEEIKEQSMVYANGFLEDKESFAEYYKNYGAVFSLTVESYVTYNDEDNISIVLDNNYSYLYAGGLDIYGININLTTGTILDNTEMLNMDEAFVEEFCKRSYAQNGEDSVGINALSNSEKLALFKNKSNLIIFYTPIGLEVGYNYSDVEGYTGWITISIEDYEQYLKGL